MNVNAKDFDATGIQYKCPLCEGTKRTEVAWVLELDSTLDGTHLYAKQSN